VAKPISAPWNWKSKAASRNRLAGAPQLTSLPHCWNAYRKPPVALPACVPPAPKNPEPHLIEKLRMLSQDTLTKPLDIFDFCLHTSPVVLLLIRLWRQLGVG
jgi:hypothetical protein